MTSRESLWWCIDIFFPWKEPLTKRECEREKQRAAALRSDIEQRILSLPDDEDVLRGHLVSCTALLSDENDRRQGIDARLTTIIGLSSVAGTVVLTVILTQQPRAGMLGLPLMSLPLYLAVQLASAVGNAILGLWRKSYLVQLPTDILPATGETPTTQLRRQIATVLDVLEDDRGLNNQKVTSMTVAHRAMLNFFCGLILLGIIGTWLALSTSSSDPLIKRLTRDQALRELLRGPEGPRGPQGPPGPQAPIERLDHKR